jgi:hypothetical protein
MAVGMIMARAGQGPQRVPSAVRPVELVGISERAIKTLRTWLRGGHGGRSDGQIERILSNLRSSGECRINSMFD